MCSCVRETFGVEFLCIGLSYLNGVRRHRAQVDNTNAIDVIEIAPRSVQGMILKLTLIDLRPAAVARPIQNGEMKCQAT